MRLIVAFRLTTLSYLRQMIPLFCLLPPILFAADKGEEDLLLAVRKNDVESVKALIAGKVNVNAKYRYDRTPLSFASDRGSSEIVKLLLDAGADVNAKDNFYGATPLSLASSKGYVEIVGMLLQRGASGRESVLIDAADQNKAAMVQMVLKAGKIDGDILSIALDKASKQRHEEIVAILKKAGAVPLPSADFRVELDILRRYEGVYRHESGRELTLSLKSGRLCLEEGSCLDAVNNVTFRLENDSGVSVVFDLDGERVVSLTVKEPGDSSTFKRVGAKP